MEKRFIYLILLITCSTTVFGQQIQLKRQVGSQSIQQNVIKRSDYFPQVEQKASFGNGVCTTMEMDALLRASNPSMGSLEDFELQFQAEIARYKEAVSNARIAEEVLTIPVIVHVFHSGQAVGEGPNISAEQINSQIDAFNEHFRKRGNGFNTHPDGADIEIEFAPAIWDPQGNRLPEPGIDRVESAKES